MLTVETSHEHLFSVGSRGGLRAKPGTPLQAHLNSTTIWFNKLADGETVMQGISLGSAKQIIHV